MFCIFGEVGKVGREGGEMSSLLGFMYTLGMPALL